MIENLFQRGMCNFHTYVTKEVSKLQCVAGSKQAYPVYRHKQDQKVSEHVCGRDRYCNLESTQTVLRYIHCRSPFIVYFITAL